VQEYAIRITVCPISLKKFDRLTSAPPFFLSYCGSVFTHITDVRGIWIHRIVDGKIVEEWECPNFLGMMQQNGAIYGLERLYLSVPLAEHAGLQYLRDRVRRDREPSPPGGL
jgi:hypothetical protein